MNKYDIFISYNRATSCKVALDIYTLLVRKGYKVFPDFRKRELWEFDDKIKNNILEAKDILVLLDEYSLKDLFDDLDYSIEHRAYDKLRDPFNRDYFIKETSFALENKSENIVSVLVDGFSLDDAVLSADIKQLTTLPIVKYVSVEKSFNTELSLKSLPDGDGLTDLLRIMERYENGDEIDIDNVDVLNGLIDVDFPHTKTIGDYLEKASFFSKKSAELGDSYGQRRYALRNFYENRYEEDRKYEEIFSWFSKSAEQGDWASLARLGAWFYLEGNAVEMDLDKGVGLLKKSAENGNCFAQHKLASIFNDNKNYKEAFYWYNKTVESGSMNSYFDLGLCYEYGIGVKKDLDKAIECYKKHTIYNYCYMNTYSCVGVSLFRKGQYYDAVKYLMNAVDREESFAMCVMALCYENGFGVEKDTSKSIYLWKKVLSFDDINNADDGSFVAMDSMSPAFASYHLARCYENGIGVRGNLKKAISLYQRALKYEEDEYDYPEERFATLSREALTRLGVESSTI